MSNPIKLAIDRQSRRLVSFNGAVTQVPDLFQSNVQDFQIQIVEPDSSGSAGTIGKYVAVDMAGFGLRLAIGAAPTGTSGGPTPLALQDTFTWDSTNKWFTGSVALNVVAIDSFIGSAAQASAYIEVNSTYSGSRITMFQGGVTLRAVLDELTSTAPSPTDQYLTKAEMLALFAKLINDAGTVIVLKSPDGTRGRELGVANDGTAIDNMITL